MEIPSLCIFAWGNKRRAALLRICLQIPWPGYAVHVACKGGQGCHTQWGQAAEGFLDNAKELGPVTSEPMSLWGRERIQESYVH